MCGTLYAVILRSVFCASRQWSLAWLRLLALRYSWSLTSTIFGQLSVSFISEVVALVSPATCVFSALRQRDRVGVEASIEWESRRAALRRVLVYTTSTVLY